jgi:hypothetical protein
VSINIGNLQLLPLVLAHEGTDQILYRLFVYKYNHRFIDHLVFSASFSQSLQDTPNLKLKSQGRNLCHSQQRAPRENVEVRPQ